MFKLSKPGKVVLELPKKKTTQIQPNETSKKGIYPTIQLGMFNPNNRDTDTLYAAEQLRDTFFFFFQMKLGIHNAGRNQNFHPKNIPQKEEEEQQQQ